MHLPNVEKTIFITPHKLYCYAWLKISVLMDMSVLGFYIYIGYIGDISMDIFT